MLPAPDRGDTTTMSSSALRETVHEINNPLFAILGLTEFLLRDVEPGSKSHERLLLIQQSGLEIKEIVKTLRDSPHEPTEAA